MCGIVGFWRLATPRPGDCERLAKMTALVSHRGPDDYGYLFANSSTGETRVTQDQHSEFTPNVLLANRRLAITDLSEAGRQPFSNDSNDVFTVFNGAIHNYLELREELIRLGYRFRSRSDTEVLLHAYEEWGPACAARFNGMWAFAIWDKRRRQLVCSRDRFGIKPLFIARKGDTFYFASEVKSILASGEISRQPNLSYIKHFLAAGTPLEGRYTPFANVEQLPAGHNLIITEKAAVEEPYWRYDDRSESYDFSTPEDTFDSLFSDAVKIRLRGDVASSLLLSGGLDSSAIAVVAARHAPGAIAAFTARFSGSRNDESQYATLAARHAGIPVTMVDYDARNLVDDLSVVSWHMDAPVAKGQMLARWSLIRTASQGQAKILLEGQGADELLAGYPSRYGEAYLRSEFDHARWGTFPSVLRRLLAATASPENRQLLKEMLIGKKRRKPPESRSLFCPRVQTAPPYEPGFPPSNSPVWGDRLTGLLWQDHANAILPYLLHFGDAISMGHSMESRLPFLDHRLVEFAFSLPFHEKIHGRESKFILRQSLKTELSPATLSRKRKVGFSTPIRQWMKPIFRTELVPLLNSSRLRNREIFDKQALGELLDVFEKRGEHAVALFRCVALEIWFRQFVDGDGFRASA